MQQEQTLREIKQRLSLRQPLAESLDLLHQLVENGALPMYKLLPESRDAELSQATQSVQQNCGSTFQSFERNFPSLTFAIATGVGKTRLMAASVLYLHRTQGVQNFFILAPSLTIYNKLIRDFGDPGYSKYVFRGVHDFVTRRPVVITGDNYTQQSGLFKDQELRINIFNIAKFNADSKVSKKDGQVRTPRLKRLSEYLGQSYWEYLSQLPDLVILMDEAHRYHADASRKALEELNPMLGIELTATPFTANGESFKNVIYEYSLARALQDGKYVKIPAVATRKDFSFAHLSEKEIEKIKLEDAISVHEDTFHAIQLYARDHGIKAVKPFILVACANIDHAKEVQAFISSSDFYEGRYAEKVIRVDSSAKDEADIELLLGVEDPQNPIEIVIHVGMLKEGWDVSNLYTIVPLRAANSLVLIEQTLGRGLRLPFGGERTGVEKVDMLTVIAHDNFEKVVSAAKDSNSIFQKIKQKQEQIKQIENEQERKRLFASLDAKKMLVDILPDIGRNSEVRKFDDLLKSDIKEKVLSQLQAAVYNGQLDAFSGILVQEATAQYEVLVNELRQNIVEIPRFVVQPVPAKTWFEDFDLDVTDFHFSKLELELVRVSIDQARHMDTIRINRNKGIADPISILLSGLIDYPEIDYDACNDLLFKLCKQAISAIQSSLSQNGQDIRLVVFDHRERLCKRIYDQLMSHFHQEETGFKYSEVYPFTRIEPWNYSLHPKFGKKHFTESINTLTSLKKYIFFGFVKSCHTEYKFDSNAEKDFATILEDDVNILRWLRPAQHQLSIYWNRQNRLYYPDFIVETKDSIYMVEIKSSNDLDDLEVIEKARAALVYCENATQYNLTQGGKKWCYLLIPHHEVVTVKRSFAYFAQNYLRTSF
jgi:type III restriction enzyme